MDHEPLRSLMWVNAAVILNPCQMGRKADVVRYIRAAGHGCRSSEAVHTTGEILTSIHAGEV